MPSMMALEGVRRRVDLNMASVKLDPLG